VLHALRDSLPLNESAHFVAQLPGLLRGIYYEQWRPSATALRRSSKADFVARVAESFKTDPLAPSAREVMVVFELLSKKISPGEIADVRHALPEHLRNLWPEHYVSAGAVP
jgi:uncharacterized protein (DUF2267 family)